MLELQLSQQCSIVIPSHKPCWWTNTILQNQLLTWLVMHTLNYLTWLPNIDIWRFSPPKDLTCKKLCYNFNHWIYIHALTTMSSTDVKKKRVAKYLLGTYSTNSRKCFCHTIGYRCLGQPMSFKNGHSWSLVHSLRILIIVNRRKGKIKHNKQTVFQITTHRAW